MEQNIDNLIALERQEDIRQEDIKEIVRDYCMPNAERLAYIQVFGLLVCLASIVGMLIVTAFPLLFVFTTTGLLGSFIVIGTFVYKSGFSNGTSTMMRILTEINDKEIPRLIAKSYRKGFVDGTKYIENNRDD